jgi:hypothetical protein
MPGSSAWASKWRNEFVQFVMEVSLWEHAATANFDGRLADR